eukprot:TRINITY_DN75_c1_g4_i1.p1 TRINITY_DN75_c1_g4~~TRINITY_DN75_c1_g4_i1.p1  ORF type:complete len:332 (+),score=72.77 TRINITY_DN75_c1_g4_i1:3-998(+)
MMAYRRAFAGLVLVVALAAAEEASSDVVVLTDANFDAELVTAGPAFVEFYAPWCGHCKRLAPTWEEFATKVKGQIQVAKVDCTTNKATCDRFGVRGFPTIKFIAGDQLYNYDSGRTIDAFETFAATYVAEGKPASPIPPPGAAAAPAEKPAEFVPPADSAVVVLTDSNFEHLTQASTGMTTGDWLVEFYAPWCGHCKALAPIWEEVAKELKGEKVVAKVDCTTNKLVCERFKVGGYPTIKLLSHGLMYNYEPAGKRTKESIVDFARAPGDESTPIPKVLTEFERAKDMLLRDLAVLYAEKKLALGVTFFAGLFLGVILSPLLRSPPKAKRE